jgi:predicted transcriptional regulator
VRIRLVTGGASGDENLQFAQAIGVQREEIIPVDWDSVRVDLVPLVLVVDRDGIVKYVHQGTVETSEVAAAIGKSGT